MAKKGTGNDRRLKWGDGWVEERVRASGETRWLARWREPNDTGGDRVLSRTFHQKDQAEAYVREKAERREAGGYISPDSITVATMVNAYIERGAHRWKSATYAAYRQRADRHLLPSLGSFTVAKLSAPLVQQWIDRMVSARLSPETIDGAARVLLGACRDAVMLGMLSSNPVSGTRRPSIKPKPVAVWTADEVRRVFATVASDPLWHAAYRLALSTGMRPGEVRVVRWSDLDLDRGLVVVRRTMTKDANGRQVVGETTKTGRVRAIALAASTIAALRQWRREQLSHRIAAIDWQDNDLVFTTARGNLITQRHWQDTHEGLVAKAGVQRITIHGMRHTAATLMLERGVPAKIVSDILGHSTVAFTQDRYQHVDERMQRHAMDDLDILLSTGTDTTT